MKHYMKNISILGHPVTQIYGYSNGSPSKHLGSARQGSLVNKAPTYLQNGPNGDVVSTRLPIKPLPTASPGLKPKERV